VTNSFNDVYDAWPCARIVSQVSAQDLTFAGRLKVVAHFRQRRISLRPSLRSGGLVP
jgi:hypothetical protein